MPRANTQGVCGNREGRAYTLPKWADTAQLSWILATSDFMKKAPRSDFLFEISFFLIKKSPTEQCE